jgi:hypothetical protein
MLTSSGYNPIPELDGRPMKSKIWPYRGRLRRQESERGWNNKMGVREN